VSEAGVVDALCSSLNLRFREHLVAEVIQPLVAPGTSNRTSLSGDSAIAKFA